MYFDKNKRRRILMFAAGRRSLKTITNNKIHCSKTFIIVLIVININSIVYKDVTVHRVTAFYVPISPFYISITAACIPAIQYLKCGQTWIYDYDFLMDPLSIYLSTTGDCFMPSAFHTYKNYCHWTWHVGRPTLIPTSNLYWLGFCFDRML